MHKLRVAMQQFNTWLSLHRRELFGVFCVLVLVIVVAHPSMARAATSAPTSVGWGEQLAIWVAQMFNYVSLGVTKLIVVLIDVVIVPIMQYNGFVSSPVVEQGWRVVRDLVNMFFVVILMIIAFQTIFSLGKADWKHQVPRLLIMAIVINFSRTIAGIFIDFGQVIMLTFVNAISDVAGGNFIQLFGLDALNNFSESHLNFISLNEGNADLIFDLFVASFLTMILTFVILATMVVLAALLAFRIVILWCLIIVSPLTFFLGGAKGVVGPAESYYADWWKRFTSAVSLGPILTFFVWLSLAAASGGSLAENQGFTQQVDANGEAASFGLISEAFNAPHMTSLIIAIALLFAGFEVSQQTAGSIGGRAGSMAAAGIKGIPGLARGLGKVGAVPALFAGGGAAAGIGLAAAGGAGLATWNTKGAADWRHKKVAEYGGRIRDFGGQLAARGIPGGRGIQNIGFKALQAQNVHSEHEWEQAAKANDAMDFANLQILAESDPESFGISKMNQMRIRHARLAITTKKKKFDKIDKKALDNAAAVLPDMGDMPDKFQDKVGAESLIAFPILAAKAKRDATQADGGRADMNKALKEQLNTMIDKPEQMRRIQGQNFETDENGVLTADGELFMEVLGEVTGRSNAGKSGLDLLQTEGRRSPSVEAFFKDNGPKVAGKKREAIDTSVAGVAGSAPEMERITREVEAIEGRRDVELALVESSVMNPEEKVMRTREVEERASAALAPLEAAFAPIQQSIDSLSATLRGLTANDIKNGALTPEHLQNPLVMAELTGSRPPAEVLKAISEAPALRAEFYDRVNDRAASAVAGGEEEVLRNTTRAGIKAGILPGYNDGEFAGDANEKAARSRALEDVVKETPEVVLDLGSAFTEANITQDIGKAVANAIQASNIDRLSQRYFAAPAGSVEQERLVNTINILSRAIDRNTVAEEKAQKLASVKKFQQRAGRGGNA